jgi:hypothetical protein
MSDLHLHLHDLQKTRLQCEKLLNGIAESFIDNGDHYARIYKIVIEQTYRAWTEVLCALYNIRGEGLWRLEDESQIINNPSTIPDVIERVSHDLRLSAESSAFQ